VPFPSVPFSAPLQAAVNLQEADIPEISQAIARLERMEAELTAIEGKLMARVGVA
jgi:hypothetical protein